MTISFQLYFRICN